MPSFRSPSSTKARTDTSVFAGTSRVNCKLSRSSKAKCINDYDRPVTRKEMYSENFREERGFFTRLFSSTQEGRGLQTGNRLIGSDQLSSPSYIRDGHVSHDQVSGSSRHVGDVVGLVRRLPSCLHPGRMSKIPVLVLVRLPMDLHGAQFLDSWFCFNIWTTDWTFIRQARDS